MRDNLNSTNTPQKSEFQDKGGEKIDKVKENILESLVGNMTSVEIRTRDMPIKRGR